MIFFKNTYTYVHIGHRHIFNKILKVNELEC